MWKIIKRWYIFLFSNYKITITIEWIIINYSKNTYRLWFGNLLLGVFGVSCLSSLSSSEISKSSKSLTRSLFSLDGNENGSTTIFVFSNESLIEFLKPFGTSTTGGISFFAFKPPIFPVTWFVEKVYLSLHFPAQFFAICDGFIPTEKIKLTLKKKNYICTVQPTALHLLVSNLLCLKTFTIILISKFLMWNVRYPMSENHNIYINIWF